MTSEFNPEETVVDLFEFYELMPAELEAIVNKHTKRLDECEDAYVVCREFCAEVEEIGYTFEWDWDGVPYSLRKIGTEIPDE